MLNHEEHEQYHELDLKRKYDHVILGTLKYDKAIRRYSVRIQCSCGDTRRRVYTSDLFQVSCCDACITRKFEIAKLKRMFAVKR